MATDGNGNVLDISNDNKKWKLLDNLKWTCGLSTIYVSNAYVTLKQIALGGEGRHCLFLGKSGLGKTTFIQWLIIYLLVEAKTSRINYNSNLENAKTEKCKGKIEKEHKENVWKYDPTIVYVEREGPRLYLKCDGSVVEYNESIHEKPNYYFSDSHDVSVSNKATRACVVICSDDIKGFKEFTKRLKEPALEGKNFVHYFPSWSFQELRHCFEDLGDEEFQFRFDVVGGNPRHMGYSNTWNSPYEIIELVEGVIGEYFGGDYVGKYNGTLTSYNKLTDKQKLGVWALKVVAAQLDAKDKDVLSSFFQMYSVTTACQKEEAVFASTFLGLVADKIINSANTTVLQALKLIFAGSGMGFAFEYEVHRSILESKSSYWCLELTSTSVARTNNTLEISLQSLSVKHIRSIEDLGSLKVGEYGLPTITNFPFGDAFVKLQNGRVVIIQATIKTKHEGAISKLKKITKAMKVENNNTVLLTMVPVEQIPSFSYQKSVNMIKQLISTSAPQASSDAIKLLAGIMKRKQKDISSANDGDDEEEEDYNSNNDDANNFNTITSSSNTTAVKRIKKTVVTDDDNNRKRNTRSNK